MFNQSILLIVLSLGLLIVSLIILIGVFIDQLKKKSDEFFIFFILIGIVLIFLIPLILGMIQEII